MFNEQSNGLPRLENLVAWGLLVLAVQNAIGVLPTQMSDTGVQSTRAAVGLVIRLRSKLKQIGDDVCVGEGRRGCEETA